MPRTAGASDVTIEYEPRRANDGADTLAAPVTTAGAGGRVKRVGDYRLLRLLGEGGMGVVWEAEQAETGRRVALKLISPSVQPTPETVDRFLREGQLAASVSHPRSTFVFGAGEHDGQPFIAMELMPGETLKDLLDREGPLPIERAVDYILDVIDGLEAAHAQGVIHRDVKPSNCFIDSEGRAKVGDFGLSKSLVSEAELTRTGAFLGTPQFAAPEQVRGAAATPATDVYAIGATLFCLLTGRGPFVGDAVSVIAQITSDPPPPLRTLRPDAPRALEQMVARTLEKNPSRRFANLSQLRQALAPFATGGSSIADVGRRLAAYMLDEFAIGLVTIGSSVIIGFIAFTVRAARASETASAPEVYSPTVNAWLQIVQAGFSVGYFALVEARWGRGLGKLLMGLRVVGPDGDRPDFARSLLRAVFVPGALGLIAVPPVLALLQLTEEQTPGINLRQTLASFLPFGFTLFCMTTMRGRNGYRGLHELVSGTRVMRVQRVSAVRRKRLPIFAPRVAEQSRAFGPFRLTGDLGRSGGQNVLQARDELLDRPVWIYDGADATAEISAARCAVARPARLHWLQRGDADHRWDAFEAVLGAPLTDVVRCGGGQWHQSRTWVLGLAEELAAAMADDTLPPSLCIEQIWITRGGQVKLLDAPLEPNQHQAAVESPAAQLTPEARAVALLREMVVLCTREQLLPSHVRTFADELAARPATRNTLDWAVSRLRDVARQPTALGWDDRLGILAVTMGTELTLYMGAAFGGVWLAETVLQWPVSVNVAMAIVSCLLPAIVGFAFRGGPAFWLTRIEVLRADGRRAGRWRCAWRNLMAWTSLTVPYAMMAAVVALMPQAGGQASGGQTPNFVFDPRESTVWYFLGGLCFAELLGALFCLGVVYALARPRRGLQDVLAGTYLMPR